MMVGSHMNITHIDEGALNWLLRIYPGLSFLDIGCGTMGMVNLALNRELDAYGVDADRNLLEIVERPERLRIHDFRQGPFIFLNQQFQVIWCVEMIEHLPAEFLHFWITSIQMNLLDSDAAPGLLVMTHAVGHNTGSHVNCQTEEYWIDLLRQNGLHYEPELSSEIRWASTMKRDFMRETGKIFTYEGDMPCLPERPSQ